MNWDVPCFCPFLCLPCPTHVSLPVPTAPRVLIYQHKKTHDTVPLNSGENGDKYERTAGKLETRPP